MELNSSHDISKMTATFNFVKYNFLTIVLTIIFGSHVSVTLTCISVSEISATCQKNVHGEKDVSDFSFRP